MVRTLLLTMSMLFMGTWLVAQTSLSGKIFDDDLKEPLFGATVKVLKGANLVKGMPTDIDGKFRFVLDPGTYDLEFSFSGFQTQKVTGVQVLTNQANYIPDVKLSATVMDIEVVITAYKVPLIEKDKTSGGQTLTSDQIKNLPTRNVNQIVATTAGTTSVDGGGINIKGSRDNATNYYIDGIRVSGSTLPVQDIEQLQVITGGLGAEYGDVTGGVISIITKGPADKYHGSVEAETSQGLDAFGWNLLTANLSGPILRKKNKEPILGFRVSGQFQHQKDDDPTAIPLTTLTDAKKKELAAQPLITVGSGVESAAEYLKPEDLRVLNYRPDEERTDLNLTGKLDLRLSKAIDVSVTGTYATYADKFTPNGTAANGYGGTDTGNGTWSNRNWLLLNTQNNPTRDNLRYRGIFRFRHRLGSDNPEADKKTTGVRIKNASYQFQFGFERANTLIQDKTHQDRFMEYGYVGQFDYEEVTVFGVRDGNSVRHLDYRYDFVGYTPSATINTGLQAYNKDVRDPKAFGSYYVTNGRFSPTFANIWQNSHANINQVFDRYRKTENDIVTFNANSSFDLNVGKMVHNIQFGILNEQRTDRQFDINPFNIWQIAEQTVNRHFNGLDTTKILRMEYYEPIGDSLPVYDYLIEEPQGNSFYADVRQGLGKNLNEYVNVHGLTPDQVNIGMFSPIELTSQPDILNYYGYDYTGNKLRSGVTFNDFFTSTTTNKSGKVVRDFPVAPLRPIYQAAYIKDKFTFDDIIMSVGVRIERFDLNTKVLKDQYSLYDIMSADEYHTKYPATPRPANVPATAKVYANDGIIEGYREGNIWFDRAGVQTDPIALIAGNTVNPFLRDTVNGVSNINSVNFNPNNSFEDYTPQVNILPRLSFSFPISDDANFFAHYDVLVQRPPSAWQTTPLDYLYFYTAGRTPLNNPNLKPERVIDYELGFQQKLNRVSAVKFSAYYREMRDMIQRRTQLYVPTIGRYDTYGNIDFGTTKGFTFQYDLRRIQNIEFRMAYTLQFAEGTGSDADSQRGLTSRGNIRNLIPLTFDERHNINAIIDYRFASGKQYNGPQIAGKDILSNFGINLQLVAASGRPYSAAQQPLRFDASGYVGSINGNRLPWRINADLRIDKSFPIGKGISAKNVNVYLRIANLLNTKNIVGVYRYTGSPDDDGYLSTLEGQSILNTAIQNGTGDDFLRAYNWSMANPNNFTQPRRIVVGGTFEF